MDRLQPLLVDVGVNLGGGNVRMAKHHLHSPQVRAVGEQVCGKGVSEHMGGNWLRDTGITCRLFYNLPEPQSCHAAASPGHKEVITPLSFEYKRSCSFQVVIELVFSLVTERDQSLLVAFACHPDKAGGQIASTGGQGDQFRYPEAR